MAGSTGPVNMGTDAIEQQPGFRETDLPPVTAYPRLATREFQFRPFLQADIHELVLLAGKHRVSDTSIGIPQPYTSEFARMWICTHAGSWEKGDALHWAVQGAFDERIRGYPGLSRVDRFRGQAELRFWVGCGVSRNRDA